MQLFIHLDKILYIYVEPILKNKQTTGIWISLDNCRMSYSFSICSLYTRLSSDCLYVGSQTVIITAYY